MVARAGAGAAAEDTALRLPRAPLLPLAAATVAVLCGALALSVGPDPYRAGWRAWQAGDFDAARAAFATAERQRGLDAPVALLHARALAALRALELRDAETCAEKLAARGGSATWPLRSFLRGAASFARARAAAAESELAGADPTALDRAIDHARAARDRFAHAWLQRPTPWPAALRNAERAARLHADLEARRAGRDQQEQQTTGAPEARPQAVPEVPEPQRPNDEQRPETPPERTLSVEELLDRIAAREQRKRRLREALRDRSSRGVEEDW